MSADLRVRRRNGRSRSRPVGLALVGLAGLGLLIWATGSEPVPEATSSRADAIDAALAVITSMAPDADVAASAEAPPPVDRHRAAARAQIERAARVLPSSWSRVIPDDQARSPVTLNFTRNGELVIDERVKDTFAYYLTTLAATVGTDEATSRLLAGLATFPEPGRTRMRDLLESYLAAESALEAHARAARSSSNGQDSAQALARLMAAGQTGDDHARRLALHEVHRAAQAFQAERERLIATHGGEDVVDLHAAMNQRARQELAVDLALSNPGSDARVRLTEALKAYGLRPRQPIDEPTGVVRQAYDSLDARGIESDRSLSAAEKRQLRRDFFGEAYVDEVARYEGVGR
ncbi:hypothetical protein ACWA7J_18205 [Leptothrix sp. BB-4]